MQVLASGLGWEFPETSFGFSAGASAHQAVERRRPYIAADTRLGHDLEKFFDRVDQDILMGDFKRVAEAL